MKLWILAVGNKMPGWVVAGFEEYTKRMPREARIELVEIKPEKRGSGKSTQQIMEVERDRLLAAIPPHAVKVVLDERGKGMPTPQLATSMNDWMRSGRDVAFIIGGADGLHEDMRRSGDLLMSLSAMVLPHGLVRVILAEQLYRAITIIQNHPYHRE